LTVILHNDLIGSFSRKEKTMKINWKFTSGLILLFALLLVACGSGGEEPAADTDTTAETGDTARTIRPLTNPLPPTKK
jgi:type II secretory pathway component PulL